MLKPYELLKNVLSEIEHGIRNGINVNELADNFSISTVHLRRLFRFAFKQTISGYIRSRRLSASLDSLLIKDFNVLDIAIEYGFEFEQSYIEAFKREFGITPGDFRRSGKILKITPPINLFDKNKLTDGVLFGPEIVMVPQFHILGKLHKIQMKNSIIEAQEAGVQFWENERFLIKNAEDPDVYIGLTRNIKWEKCISEYLPSLKVKNLKTIPEGFCGDTFETSLCVKFRYIGQHHYLEINAGRAESMYVAIEKFFSEEQEGYDHIHNTYNPQKTNYRIHHFEKIDTRRYDGTYCQMEWFAPIKAKNPEKYVK